MAATARLQTLHIYTASEAELSMYHNATSLMRCIALQCPFSADWKSHKQSCKALQRLQKALGDPQQGQQEEQEQQVGGSVSCSRFAATPAAPHVRLCLSFPMCHFPLSAPLCHSVHRQHDGCLLPRPAERPHHQSQTPMELQTNQFLLANVCLWSLAWALTLAPKPCSRH
jgi:hypothetical protein